MQIRRRGHVNATPFTRVVVDSSVVTAALQPHTADVANPHQTTARQTGAVPQLAALAVTAPHAGLTRVFLGDAWRWHARTLGRILLLASLRG